MAKEKDTKISVTTIFAGKQEGRQAFIDLILQKRRTESDHFSIDDRRIKCYNDGKVFSDVHAV